VSPLRDAVVRAWGDARGRAGALILAAVAVGAAAGPLVLPDPLAQPCVLTCRNLGPSLDHPLGTDDLSRDILARVATGGRISLSVALLAVALSVTLGAVTGLVSGYLGGAVDTVLMRLVDAALAIPRLFLLLLVLAVWEQVPVPVLVLLIGATGWFGTGRLAVRAVDHVPVSAVGLPLCTARLEGLVKLSRASVGDADVIEFRLRRPRAHERAAAEARLRR
jgi:peptide/nickel transport system permease protein